MPFNQRDLKPVELADRAKLEPRLLASNPTTCECNFQNMFIWGLFYKTKWALHNGRIWSHLEEDDELLYPLGGAGFASPEEMREVSDAMRKAGFNGIFRQVPEAYIKARPEILKSFDAEQVPEAVGEYVYSVERLAKLPGSKLGKKRNLISQFLRANPDFHAETLTAARLPECMALVESWRKEKVSEMPEEIEHETVALDASFAHFKELGMEGVAAYSGERLVAFSMFSRVSDTMFTEHFEKADASAKGAAQVINNETAKAILGRAALLNREQDMGLEGLRHAKRSYDPLYLVRNFSLTPKG